MGKENRWTQFSSKANRVFRGIKGGSGSGDDHNRDKTPNRNRTHRHTKSEPINSSLPWGGLGPNAAEGDMNMSTNSNNVPIVDVVPSDDRDRDRDGFPPHMVENSREKDLQGKEIVDSYLKDSRRDIYDGMDDDDDDDDVNNIVATPTTQKKNTKRLDEYGFIVNIDDTGMLRDESSVDIPGGAYTPSANSNANSKSKSKLKTPNNYNNHNNSNTGSSIQKKFKLGGGGIGIGIGSEKKSNKSNKKSKTSRKEERQMKRLKRRREKKWLTMLAQWDEHSLATSKQKRNKLRQRVRKGIPNSCRGKGWAKLANLQKKIDVTHVGVYAKLVAESSGPDSNDIDDVNDMALNPNPNADVNVDRRVMKETIERDLTRTFPRHSMFYDSYSDESSDEEDNDDASFDKVSVSGSFDSGNSHDGSQSIEEGGVTCTFSNEDYGDEEVELHLKSSSKDMAATGDGDGNRNGNGNGNGANRNVSYETDDHHDRSEQQNDECWSKSAVKTIQYHLSSNCPTPPNFGGKKENPLEVVHATTPIRPPAPAPPPPPSSPRVRSSAHRKKEKVVVDYSQAEGGQASLRRVLRAYSIYDPEVGYCQGMNFIAGMFITFMSEEEAFWLLVHVMSESPCRMRGLFGEGMSEAHQVLYVAERLISQFHPRLARHFDRENVHITMFATQWLLTMYTSSFPFDMVTRVWDAFLSEGWKVTYRVMLALLEKAQPILMKMPFEDILNYFKELPFQIDSNEIMENAFKIPLKKKHIGKYAKEWVQKQKERENEQRQLG